MIKTTVILPARNEEELIAEVLKDVLKHLKKKKYQFEILVITNGCQDNTAAIVKKLQKKEKEIKLLSSIPGYGHALRKGLKYAMGKYLVIYNVDFYDLKLIDFIDADLFGKDIILGSKNTFWSTDKRPLARKIATKLLNVYLKLIYGFKGSDTHGIKLIRKEVRNKILPLCKTTSGIFDSEFIIRSQRQGYKIFDYPVAISEKRLPRFSNRLFQTPFDLHNLHQALKS